MDFAIAHEAVLTAIGICILFALFFSLFGGYRLFGIAMIPDDGIGIVTKKFGFVSSRLPDGRVIALNREAGFQADTLAPGLYWGYWPWQYSVDTAKFITIPQGKVGIVEAIDGNPIPTGRILGQHVECDCFQSARDFLSHGGQRGPQSDVIPPGTYRINSQAFKITLCEALVIPQGKVGIVTTLEGDPPGTNDIAGPIVPNHNAFQNAHAFVASGGRKGLQEQVMLAGMYYLNPLFVKVGTIEMVDIPIGSVGVVVSFVGPEGKDISGAEFTHGNIVAKGERGVWATPLDPGRYPINLMIARIEVVPTTNIVLNWADSKTEAHNLDKELSTITVRSQDGYAFNLDVSQIIHVSREDAPRVIARFGTMVNLVTQVLEPTIGNYFRNSAQSSDVMDFLKGRSQRQKEAAQYIGDALKGYNVQAVDTLIGDINPPAQLMQTLTDRKLAEQESVTFQTQQKTQVQRQEFEKAKSEADTRGQVVAAQRAAEVAKLAADQAVNRANGESQARIINAEAEARALALVGEATAKRTESVGGAEAEVLKKKVDAVGANFYAMMNVISSLGEAKTALVPQIMVGGTGDNKSNLMEAFLGNLLASKLEDARGTNGTGVHPINPQSRAITPALDH